MASDDRRLQRLLGAVARAVEQHDVADVARRRVAVGGEEPVDAAVVAEHAIGQRECRTRCRCRSRCAVPHATPASSAAVPCCRGIRDRRRRPRRFRPSRAASERSGRDRAASCAGCRPAAGRCADSRPAVPSAVVAAREQRLVVGRRAGSCSSSSRAGRRCRALDVVLVRLAGDLSRGRARRRRSRRSSTHMRVPGRQRTRREPRIPRQRLGERHLGLRRRGRSDR